MPTNVVMPQMGESIAEGTIVRWIKKVGDEVDRDEPLFEISTDKVDAEIPSPGGRRADRIKVEGRRDRPGQQRRRDHRRRARPEQAGRRPDRSTAPRRRLMRAGRASCPAAAAGEPEVRSLRAPRRPRRAERGRSAAPEVLAARAAHRAGTQRRHQADPRHRHQRPGHEAGHPRLHRTRGRRRAGGRHGAPSGRAAGQCTFKPGESVSIVPMTVMRKKIAEHMVLSAHTSPHVYSVYEVNFGRVAALRESRRRRSSRRPARSSRSPRSSPRSPSTRCASSRSSTPRSTATTSSTRRTSTSASRWRSTTA